MNVELNNYCNVCNRKLQKIVISSAVLLFCEADSNCVSYAKIGERYCGKHLVHKNNQCVCGLKVLKESI